VLGHAGDRSSSGGTASSGFSAANAVHMPFLLEQRVMSASEPADLRFSLGRPTLMTGVRRAEQVSSVPHASGAIHFTNAHCQYKCHGWPMRDGGRLAQLTGSIGIEFPGEGEKAIDRRSTFTSD
jgi:hypothetical protein